MASGVAPTEDPFGGRAFVSPAKIRILLTPTGPDVSPADFDQWAACVRSFESIRLADLPESVTGRAGPVSGSALHRFGEIHLSFVTSYDPSHSFLAPFALHKQVLGVLGLGSFTESHASGDFDGVPSALRELYPSAIVHRAFIFDSQAGKDLSSPIDHLKDNPVKAHTRDESTDADVQPNAGSGAGSKTSFEMPAVSAGFSQAGNSGLVFFPAVRRDGKDVRFYLKTLLRDFIGTLLDGLWDIVKGLEGKALETPRETLGDGVAPQKQGASTSSVSDDAQPSASPSNAASRASSFFGSLGSNSTPVSAAGPVGGGTQPAGLTIGQSRPEETKSAVSKSSAAASTKGKRASSLAGAGPAGAGRYAKVRADYSLLSGDLWSAIAGYDACMTWLGKDRALAGGQDAVWYASALEGWAVTRCLIFRMSGLEEKGPSLALPGSSTKEKEKKDKTASTDAPFANQEWADIAEAYSLALQIYSKTLAPPRSVLATARSVTSDTPRDYTHPLVHASACIGYSRLLLAIWASSGWNPECFDQLIYGGVPPALVEDARPGPAMYATLSKASGVERHDIAAPASLALSHSVSALKPPDQISILCSLANVYGCIGFLRREAYLLRQLQAAVVSLLARALILHPREPHTVARMLGQITDFGHPELGSLVSQTVTSGLGSGADAVLILALQICETYGINVDIEPLKNIPSHHILSRAAVAGKTTATGEPLLKRTGRASWATQGDLTASRQSQDAISLAQGDDNFGWADLQIALLKDTICVAEMLQDHVGMAFFAAILLRDFHVLLSGEEQQSLIRGLSRCVTTARRHDAHHLEVLYWGPLEPLCSIEIESLQPARVVTEQPVSQLRQPSPSGQPKEDSVAGSNNPFFWNPRRSFGSKVKQTSLVQGEEAAFFVTLQNPFETALDLSSVRLSTSGAAFNSDTVSVSLPPAAFHTLRLTGRPSEPGKVAFQGVFITLAGCQEREFRVLLHDESTLKLTRTLEADADDRRTRLKVQGLDARPAFLAQKRSDAAETGDGKAAHQKHSDTNRLSKRYLQCEVVHAQPLLTVDSPMLQHGHMDLYEGETSILKLRLTNHSDLPVDFATIQITDDLSEAVKTALDEGDLLPEDAYQLEHSLVQQPVARLPPKAGHLRVSAQGSLIVPLKVLGKLDCTRVTVNIDYAHVHGPGRGGLVTETTSLFHTRKATFEFGVTVQPLLELGPLDLHLTRLDKALMPRVGETAPARPAARLADGLKARPERSSRHACVLGIDVQNTQQSPVSVTFVLDGHEQQAPDLGRVTVTRTVAALTTARISLPLDKIDLPAVQTDKPIPSLSSRQFILSRVKLTPSEERLAKQRFWYRNELLRRLRAHWTDERTGRTGTLIGLDETVLLNDEQLDMLRVHPVSITLSFEDESGSRDPASCQMPKAAPQSFASIVGTVHNQSDHALRLLYRLVPLPSAALSPTADSAVASSSVPGTAQPASQGAALMPLAAAGHHSNDAVLSRLLITNGGLSRPVQPWPLGPGQTSEPIPVGVTFLAQGSFGFLACVEEEGEELRRDGSAASSRDGLRSQISRISEDALIVNVTENGTSHSRLLR
ncbi:unnamed protein product [Parajaminaea phylloscopi]